MTRVVGVDEAGKGPVLGSMFAAAVAADPAALPDDVDDSKRLSPARREDLDARIRDDDRILVGVASVPPERIDAPDTDMNTLTVEAHAAALAAVLDDCEADACVVDAGDTDAERFGRRIMDRIDREIELAAEHGADAEYAVVAAASVVAKVARDAHVADLAATHGEVGSGYPSDPTTRAFLREFVREHGSLPACARASWQTCDDVLAAHAQSSLDSF